MKKSKSILISEREYEGLQRLVEHHSIKAFELEQKVERLENENNNLAQLVIILNKYYSRFSLTGKMVLDMSEEAEILSYRDMSILQHTLEDLAKGHIVYKD